ncbi:CARDB domain-containing protein [Alkaliphilus transvaalensis]|uniref:CARDB domain-containing protein n=1 Tax=Alkaliphilus transvaalensis TaxID=114628 RepID=UPI00047D2F86|nr:CARDB domain-containing protein [Alkaliphilus transvaalensis]
MKIFTKNKYIVLILTLVFLSTNILYAQNLNFGGIDYINTKGEIISFGGNLWNDNYSKGTAIFPLSEAWSPVQVGHSDGQPLIVDGIIFTISGKNLTAINQKTGEILRTTNIQMIYPHFNSSNLFVLKHSNEKYQLITPSKDGKILSIMANVVRNNDEGIVGLSYSQHWQWDVTKLERTGLTVSQILTNSVTVLKDANPSINKAYLGFGTYTGHMVVLDATSGVPVVNGAVEFDSILGSGSGIVYRNFADIILPSNNPSKNVGGVVGGTVHNGVLNLNLGNTKDFHTEGIIGPMAYAVINNIGTGGTRGMLVAQDKLGRIVAYDTSNNALLYMVDKYVGTSTINSISIAGKYLLVTFAEEKNGRSRIVSINYERAIEAAQYDTNKLANDAIVFEESFDSHSYSGATAVSVAEQELDSFGNIKEVIYREVFMVANRSTNSSTKNIQMFYLDQYHSNTKRPISVPYAFQREESSGVFNTTNGLHITGGVTSQLSYGGGYLIFVDGRGYLHAYTAVKENNLALVNFENSSELLEKGNTYQAVVDVVNYTGEFQENIPIEFWINDEKIHEGRIDFGADGITVNFQYTIPLNYDKDYLKLDAKLNMVTPRTLNEKTYDDNIATLMVDVMKQEELDLEVSKITHSRFFRGQYGIVNVHVKNNSDKTIASPSVPVRLQIAGTNVELVEQINLAPNATSTVSFRVQVPDQLMSFVLVAEVNHTRVYTETNYANNRKQATANIINAFASTGCINSSTTWEEYRSVDQYTSGSIVNRHYESRFSHYNYVQGGVIGTGPNGNPIYSQIPVPVYVNVLVGYTVRFQATLNGTMTVTPNSIKAGYGIEVEAETWVTTNYDKPYKLTNSQSIYAYFPDSNTPVMLEPQGNVSSLSKVKWILPQNLQSVFRERRHYIPVEWPDGPYKISLDMQNAVTPSVALCRQMEGSITIDGQMYEDDHTGIR